MLLFVIIINSPMQSVEVEEGFISNIYENNNQFHNQPIFISYSKQQPNFQAKYLSNNGVLWKQPKQVYDHFQECTIKQQRQDQYLYNKNKTIKPKQQLRHPYYLYSKNPQYKLIYSRKKGQPFNPLQNDYAKNEVSLIHLQKKSSDSYRKIREFSIHHQIYKQDLIIDSKFESGNLYCAYKLINKQQYVLFIQNDTNTLGYNQWFYFSIKGAQKGVNYKFHIVNFKKKHSIFKFGYKLAIFSLINSQKGNGWSRGGDNIVYTDSGIGQFPKYKYYSLSFDIIPQHSNDCLLISMGLPYSYTKMMKSLQKFQEIAKQKNINWRLSKVCQSLGGNIVPQITITSNLQSKKYIIIIGRQHPGETWSSFIIQEFIKSLLSKTQHSKYLLQKYIFKIFPMINVDGVIYGNFRCDLSGVDLNRRWKNPSPNLHPQIYQIKKIINRLSKRNKIQCCLDMHGHSKDYNIFCYSCQDNIYTARILPYLIHLNSPFFYFPSCTFGISKYKSTTARAAIYNIIKNQNVLTIETSFYGYKNNGVTYHFQPKDMASISRSIIKSLNQFLDGKNPKKAQIEKQLKQKASQLIISHESNSINDQSGSESQPEVDEIDFQIKALKIFPAKFQSQSHYFVKVNEQVYTKLQTINIEQKKQSQPKIKSNENQNNNDKDSQKIKITKDTKINIYINNKKSNATINNNITNFKKSTIIGSYNKKKQSNKYQINKYNNQILQKYSAHQDKFESLNNNQQKLLLDLKRQVKQKRQMLSLQLKNTSTSRYQIPQTNSYSIEKFLPSNNIKSKKRNLSFLKQVIYDEDQVQMIKKLKINKQMIELQKFKRNLQCNLKVPRKLKKIKNFNQSDSIVNFSKYQQNKINQNELQNLMNLSYLKNQSNNYQY